MVPAFSGLAMHARQTVEANPASVLRLRVEPPGKLFPRPGTGGGGMPKRKVLVLEKADDGWKLLSEGRTLTQGKRKDETLRNAVRIAREQHPSSLRIKGRNGRVQEERTYPRSSDPRRSKG